MAEQVTGSIANDERFLTQHDIAPQLGVEHR
jgi:hypothetical protein